MSLHSKSFVTKRHWEGTSHGVRRVLLTIVTLTVGITCGLIDLQLFVMQKWSS